MPENEWIYGTLLRIPHPPVCIGKEENDKYYIQFTDPRYMPDWNMPYKMVQGEVKEETIGQYTGLKDKNGTEIYEGDIVGDSSIKWVVKWCKHRMGFSLYPTTEQIYDEMPINVTEKLNFEVIGNIYDNPDLLEEGAEDE